MSSTMTPLCGFGMGDSSSVTPPAPRKLQQEPTSEGEVIQLEESETDGMLIMWPDAVLNMVTLVLPQNSPVLQIRGIASMQMVSAITFTGGTILNPPTELLPNQAVLLQRIAADSNTWILLL